MLSISQLCRGAPLRAMQARAYAGARAAPSRSGRAPAMVLARQVYTPARIGSSSRLVIRMKEMLKFGSVRLQSTAPPAGAARAVGFWLLGCSGMVFTAVALNGLSFLTETGLAAAVVLLPGAYFLYRGRLDNAMRTRLAVCGVLLFAAQGRRFWTPSPELPHIAKFQRAADVGLAMLLFATLVSGALRVLRPAPAGRLMQGLTGTTVLANTVKGMTIGTAVAGTLVAGLNAYASTLSSTPTVLPAPHKPLGVLTMLVTTACWLLARRAPLTPQARRAASVLAAVAWLQVTLGVLAAGDLIPTSLRPSHKTGSLVLLTAATCFTHELKFIKYVPK